MNVALSNHTRAAHAAQHAALKLMMSSMHLLSLTACGGCVNYGNQDRN